MTSPSRFYRNYGRPLLPLRVVWNHSLTRPLNARKSWKLGPTCLVTLLIQGPSAKLLNCSPHCLHHRLVVSCSMATSTGATFSSRDEVGWPSTLHRWPA